MSHWYHINTSVFSYNTALSAQLPCLACLYLYFFKTMFLLNFKSFSKNLISLLFVVFRTINRPKNTNIQVFPFSYLRLALRILRLNGDKLFRSLTNKLVRVVQVTGGQKTQHHIYIQGRIQVRSVQGTGGQKTQHHIQRRIQVRSVQVTAWVEDTISYIVADTGQISSSDRWVDIFFKLEQLSSKPN